MIHFEQETPTGQPGWAGFDVHTEQETALALLGYGFWPVVQHGEPVGRRRTSCLGRPCGPDRRAGRLRNDPLLVKRDVVEIAADDLQWFRSTRWKIER